MIIWGFRRRSGSGSRAVSGATPFPPLEERGKTSFQTQSCNKKIPVARGPLCPFWLASLSIRFHTTWQKKMEELIVSFNFSNMSGLRTAIVHFPCLILSHTLCCILQPLPFWEFRWPVACAGISLPNFILPDIFGIRKKKPYSTHTPFYLWNLSFSWSKHGTGAGQDYTQLF